MPQSLPINRKEPQRVPPVRSDCERDFREKFGRCMTEREKDFLHLGNAVLDGIDEDDPERRVSATLLERAWRTRQDSHQAVGRAVRICEESRGLVATARLLIGKMQKQCPARSQKHKLRKLA